MRPILAILIALLPLGAAAGPCDGRDYVAAWLEARGLHIADWGLSPAGDMDELFIGEEGWAILRTTPERCASVLSMPYETGGRLSEAPRNSGVTPAGPLIAGQGA